MSVDKRFDGKFLRRDPDECWPWAAGQRGGGYGGFHLDGREVYAHRYALERKIGRKLEEGELALHSCDNRLCVNPDHLRVGSIKDNVIDCMIRGRRAEQVQTHFKCGHERTMDNTYIVRTEGKIKRRCKTCERQRKRKAS